MKQILHGRKFLRILLITVFVALVALSCFGCVVESGEGSLLSLTVVQSPIELAVGESVTLSADGSQQNGEIVWFSADESIVTVADGTVTGVSEGTTQVYCITDNLTAECRVTVTAAQQSTEISNALIISLSPVSLGVDETLTISAIAPSGGTVKWYSSDTSVATVAEGVVTGVKEGSVTVTASVGNASVSCKIEVVKIIRPVISNGETRLSYNLCWSDEFDGAALDSSKWTYQTGIQDTETGGPLYWGNNEQQYYTSSSGNIGVADGSLYITAKKESMGDRDYTSARIITRGNFSFTYGYVEAKMKLPAESGLWPAFWMLPQPLTATSGDNEYGSWPVNGEIDIMEARGRQPDRVDATLHYAYSNGTHKYSTTSCTVDGSIDEWHVYGLEWTETYITWYIDGVAVKTCDYKSWQNSSLSTQNAPFDKPFFLLLNLAVGGNYDSGVTPGDDFTSASMYVDYIRVFKQN